MFRPLKKPKSNWVNEKIDHFERDGIGHQTEGKKCAGR